MKITVQIAANALGCSAQAVRIGLQRGLLPIGTAIRLKDKNYQYIIPEHKLADYVGCSVEELAKYREGDS